MTTKLTCYISFDNGFNIYNQLQKNILAMVSEIIAAGNQFVIPMGEFMSVTPKIDLINSSELPDDHEFVKAVKDNKLNRNSRDKWLTKNLLAINIELTIPDTLDEIFLKTITEIDKSLLDTLSAEEMNRILILTTFKKRILDLIAAANLAHFGSLQLLKGFVIQDSNIIEQIDEVKCYTLYHAMEFSEKIGYPMLRRLNFLKVWNWIIKREDFLIGFSNDTTGRALCCFRMLLNSEHPNLLFMSIMGIEALYTKGTGNLQDQVREKSQVLLGKQESFKKLYANMYNFRSRYIHGDLDFPTYDNLDYTDKTTNYNKELEEATYYSIALLGASLQELVIRDWCGLDFNYNVSDYKK